MNIKTIAFAVLAIAATSGLQAQDVKPTQDPQVSQQRDQERIARTNESSAKLASQLGLDVKQTAALKELDERYARQLNEVRNQTTDRAVIMEKDKSMRASYEAELRDMLTPEQFQQVMSMVDPKDSKQEIRSVPVER